MFTVKNNFGRLAKTTQTHSRASTEMVGAANFFQVPA